MLNSRQARLHLLTGVVACVVLAPSPARAYHTSTDHITYETAYTLHRGQWRIGTFDLGYGLHERLTIGTGFTIWAAGGIALRAPAPNFYLKSTFFQRNRIAMSVTAGASWIPGRWNGVDVNLFLVPASLAISVIPTRRVTLSFELSYAFSRIRAKTAPTDQTIDGLAAVNGLFGTLSLQTNVSRVTAFVLSSHLMFSTWGPFVKGNLDLGGGATASVSGSYVIPDLNHAWNAILSVVFSWRIVNLRLGVGYGSYFLRRPDFVRPSASVVPDFDFYVRF